MAELGIDVGKIFNQGVSGLNKDGESLQAKISAASGKNLSQGDLLQIQFEMGQYNAKLEMVSSITKSMQDMLKSLAQRTG